MIARFKIVIAILMAIFFLIACEEGRAPTAPKLSTEEYCMKLSLSIRYATLQRRVEIYEGCLVYKEAKGEFRQTKD